MKINILIGLFLISFLQTECANNAQQNKSKENDEPVNLIIDEVVTTDSVYYLCSEKFASLIKNPNEKLFFELENEFDYADNNSELLLYYLVAANKLGLDVAKIRVANCLTQSLSCPNIGKNSREIALFYLKKWESSTKHKRGKEIIERFEASSDDDIEMVISAITDDEHQIIIPAATDDDHEMIYPTITYKSSEMKCQKIGCLKGSVEDYKKLKEMMYNAGMYPFMLYYAYIMADRYDYQPAKEDVVTIINRFYRENHLEPIDKDTQYFCSFFKK